MEVKISINGKDIIARDIEIVDNLVVLRFGQYEVKIPLEEWEKAE